MDNLTPEDYVKYMINPDTKLRYQSDDLFWVGVSALFFFFFRIFATFLVYRPLANYWKISKEATKEEPVSRFNKFIENAYYSTVYPLFAIYGIYIAYGGDYIWNAPVTQPHFELIFDTRYLYIIELGFYLSLLFNLVVIDMRTSDFAELFIHHNVTIFLICFSYLFCYHQVGICLLVLHDVVDVFLYWAKAAHNSDWEMPANIFFFIFTITFFVMRLVYLPYLLYISTKNPLQHLHPTYFFNEKVAEKLTHFEFATVCSKGHCFYLHQFLYWFVSILICLHIMWFYKVLLVLKKTLSDNGQFKGDPRTKKTD